MPFGSLLLPPNQSQSYIRYLAPFCIPMFWRSPLVQDPGCCGRRFALGLSFHVSSRSDCRRAPCWIRKRFKRLHGNVTCFFSSTKKNVKILAYSSCKVMLLADFFGVETSSNVSTLAFTNFTMLIALTTFGCPWCFLARGRQIAPLYNQHWWLMIYTAFGLNICVLQWGYSVSFQTV